MAQGESTNQNVGDRAFTQDALPPLVDVAGPRGVRLLAVRGGPILGSDHAHAAQKLLLRVPIPTENGCHLNEAHGTDDQASRLPRVQESGGCVAEGRISNRHIDQQTSVDNPGHYSSPSRSSSNHWPVVRGSG